MGEKTYIQKIVDLLEESGYHVFKAEEEEHPQTGISSLPLTILLRIAPYKGKEQC